MFDLFRGIYKEKSDEEIIAKVKDGICEGGSSCRCTVHPCIDNNCEENQNYHQEVEDISHLLDHIEKLKIKHENNYFVKRTKNAIVQSTTNVGELSNEMMYKISGYLTTKEKIYTAMSMTCLNNKCEGEVQDYTSRFGLSTIECGITYGCEKKFCGCKECYEVHFDFCPECEAFFCVDCLGSYSDGGCMYNDKGSCKLKGCWECHKGGLCAGCGNHLCKTCGMKSPCCGLRYCRYEEMLECCDGAPMTTHGW